MSQEELNARAKNAVMTYKADEAKKVAQEAVDTGADLVSLIQNGFTAGIKEVGDLFEAKKLFLPHIMAAANVMNWSPEPPATPSESSSSAPSRVTSTPSERTSSPS